MFDVGDQIRVIKDWFGDKSGSVGTVVSYHVFPDQSVSYNARDSKGNIFGFIDSDEVLCIDRLKNYGVEDD